MLAHCLGLAGELFNCLGAIILALDIFLRRKGEQELRDLDDMSQYAQTANSPAIYKGFAVASPHFAGDVTHWNAKRLAFAGSAMLVVGFALLVGYHLLEIRDIQQNRTTPSEIRNSNI